MPKDHEKQRVVTRRAMVLGSVQLGVLAVLTGRLAWLQFFKSDEYASLSENNHIKLQPVPADRGAILDRFGEIIADNRKNFRLYIDPSSITPETYAKSLAEVEKLIEVPEKRRVQLKTVRASANTPPQIIKDELSWDEVSRIELNTLSLPGVYIETAQVRWYPYGQVFAHLTGYMGAASEAEMKRDEEQPLLRLPDFKIGKSGIEKTLEKPLRGKAGVRKLEVNAQGMVVREVGRTESVPGKNTRLTIDRETQLLAAERIKDESASVVAIEIETGNVLTLTSVPAFDPNVFSQGITHKEWDRLSADKKVPLLNKPIGGIYPPGSTFKMMVGLAGMEQGIVKPSFQVHCPGYFMLGDHRFRCWKQGGHGLMNYTKAIEQSCDTYFYTVAQRIGQEPTADVSRRCGLGQLHDIGIIGEKSGIMPDAKWKMDTYKQRWTMGDTINCSIGQGYVITTPLQLAVMTARLASGRMVKPRLWVEEGQENPKFDPLAIDPDFLERTRFAMSEVVNGSSGTARGSRIQEPRFAFAGKTGTAQVRRLIAQGVNQASLPWEHRHHALFVGFAPVDKPKYAVAVVVEHGGGGSAAAAPVAKEVLLRLQEIDERPPKSAG